ALAVRAADRYDAVRRHGDLERREHVANALEAKIDLLRVQRFEPSEPFGQRFKTRRNGRRRASQAQTASGLDMSLASSAAISSRALRRSTIMSSAPFSSKNSARWNPSGSVSPTVCSMTRGPANPISDPGSAILTSPSMPRLADTPPMVGSVSTEM